MQRSGLVHHSDRGSQYVSIKYTERLADAGIEPAVGSVGGSCDNALAETVNRFNHRRLLNPIGNIPPAEAKARYFTALDQTKIAA